ncbi:MAG: hypothetical protein Q9213_007179 [Squamulea squamosa]
MPPTTVPIVYPKFSITTILLYFIAMVAAHTIICVSLSTLLGYTDPIEYLNDNQLHVVGLQYAIYLVLYGVYVEVKFHRTLAGPLRGMYQLRDEERGVKVVLTEGDMREEKALIVDTPAGTCHDDLWEVHSGDNVRLAAWNVLFGG